MGAKPGDRVVVESKRAQKHGRTGVIERVLDEATPRYEVKWDNGGTTIVAPEAGSLRVETRAGGARRA
jgi:hypothetical protein